jgi:hypothetical protein
MLTVTCGPYGESSKRINYYRHHQLANTILTGNRVCPSASLYRNQHVLRADLDPSEGAKTKTSH